MAWEELLKTGGPGQQRGGDWRSRPCVGVNKSGLSMNQVFLESYDLRFGDYLFVLIDRDNHRLGFKKGDACNGSVIGAFKIQPNTGGSKTTKAGKLSVRAVARAFPDAVSKIFRAGLNSEERVIEVSLSTTNEAKAS